jgi:hypothetical protein
MGAARPTPESGAARASRQPLLQQLQELRLIGRLVAKSWVFGE